MMAGTLILLRHGQSVWNAANRFTGWVDVDLTARGTEEAQAAGRLLSRHHLLPDVAHTSLLRRAIVTTHLALDTADRLWIPQQRSWRLNERHYGALAGLDKADTASRYGTEQVHLWRRSYTVQPPALDDVSTFTNDARYRNIETNMFPRTESLRDVQTRLVPYWENEIVPQLVNGLCVLVGAHGNSLRALVKHIEQVSDEAVIDLEIATGVPRVYTTTVNFDGKLEYSPAHVLAA